MGSEVRENSREVMKISMFYKVVVIVQPLVVKRHKLQNTGVNYKERGTSFSWRKRSPAIY